MRIRNLVILLAIVAGGCAVDLEADPENDRLATGQSVMLFSDKSEDVVLMHDADDFEKVPVGTRAEVVADTQPDPEKAHRKTLVTVRQGPKEGKVGKVFRDNLRPVDASQ